MGTKMKNATPNFSDFFFPGGFLSCDEWINLFMWICTLDNKTSKNTTLRTTRGMRTDKKCKWGTELCHFISSSYLLYINNNNLNRKYSQEGMPPIDLWPKPPTPPAPFTPFIKKQQSLLTQSLLTLSTSLPSTANVRLSQSSSSSTTPHIQSNERALVW